MVVYAICDKFGIISLQTKSKNNVITSSMIMAYASEKRAKEKLELIRKLYDMDEEELHTKMWNNNFMTSLPHFARDVYGCKE